MDPRRLAGLSVVVACLVLLGQIAVWMAVQGRDRTPLVDDSGEVYLFALQRRNGWEVEASGRPPLPHNALAAWLAVVGAGRMPVRAWCLLGYVVLVGLTFAAAGSLADDGEPDQPAVAAPVGALAAALVAGLPAMIGASRYLIPDQLAALLMTGAFVARRRPLLACALGAAALLAKLTCWVYLVPLLPWLAARARTEPRWRLGLLAGLAPAAWLAWHAAPVARFYLTQPDWSHVDRALGTSRLAPEYWLAYPRLFATHVVGEALALPLGAGLVAGWRLPVVRRGVAYALAVGAALTLMPNRAPRYLLPLLPLLAALSAIGWSRWLRARGARLGPALAGALLAGALIFGAAGVAWSASLLDPAWGDRYAPVRDHHRAGALDAEELAALGLFAPIDADWGGTALADAIAAEPRVGRDPVLPIGARSFVRWDLRLRLAERGLDLPWTLPRDADRDPALRDDAADFVLLSDYSGRERDLIRHNLEPYTQAEMELRGHAAEERLRAWFETRRADYALVHALVTRDARRVELWRRR